MVVAQCASEPQGTMSRLHTIADRVRDVRVFSVLTLKPYDFYAKPEMKGHFELASWFHAPGSREALKKGTGTVTFVPNMLHRAATDRIHARRPDVFIGTCTPPDRNGFVSLSLGITYEKDILEAASTVILEVNPRLPRTLGDTHLRVTEATYFVEHDQEVPSLPAPAPTETDLAIGGYIADLVEDGSTIQLGHRRHPERRRPGASGQEGPGSAHRDDGGLHDGALRDGRHHQSPQVPVQRQVRVHLRHGRRARSTTGWTTTWPWSSAAAAG